MEVPVLTRTCQVHPPFRPWKAGVAPFECAKRTAAEIRFTMFPLLIDSTSGNVAINLLRTPHIISCILELHSSIAPRTCLRFRVIVLPNWLDSVPVYHTCVLTPRCFRSPFATSWWPRVSIFIQLNDCPGKASNAVHLQKWRKSLEEVWNFAEDLTAWHVFWQRIITLYFCV